MLLTLLLLGGRLGCCARRLPRSAAAPPGFSRRMQVQQGTRCWCLGAARRAPRCQHRECELVGRRRGANGSLHALDSRALQMEAPIGPSEPPLPRAGRCRHCRAACEALRLAKGCQPLCRQQPMCLQIMQIMSNVLASGVKPAFARRTALASCPAVAGRPMVPRGSALFLTSTSSSYTQYRISLYI